MEYIFNKIAKVIKTKSLVHITMDVEELKSAGLSELLAGLDDIRIAYLKGYIDGMKNEDKSESKK